MWWRSDALFTSEAADRDGLSLSVVVPAYKEEEYIQQTLREIVNACGDAGISCELVVVVDIVPGDKTAAYIREVSESNSKVRVLEHMGRRGVGDAVRAGISMARGKVLVVAMGDQSEDPNDVVRLAESCVNCDIVFTNRFGHGRPRDYPWVKYIANRACNIAAKLVVGIPYSDTTNAFKAYNLESLRRVKLTSNGFEIFLEMPLKVMKSTNIRSQEIQVNHAVRRKKSAKLSVTKDGYGYLRVLLSSLFDSIY